MAVTVNEISDGQATGSFGQQNARSYTKIFQVVTDNVGYDQRAVLLLPGIPLRRSPYYSSTGVDHRAFCRDVTATRDSSSRLVWKVVATYENLGAAQGGAASVNPGTHDNDDPTQDPPILSWDNTLESRAVVKDKDGKPIANLAGEPYEAVEFGFPKTKLTVDVNLLVYNQSLAEDYVGSVNNDAWMNGDPRMWRCMGIKGTPAYKDIDYYKVQIIFEKKTDLWDLSLVNAGFRQKDANSKLVAIKDEFGQDVQSPFPLDANGKALSFTDSLDPTKWTFNTFRIPDELPFSSVFPF